MQNEVFLNWQFESCSCNVVTSFIHTDSESEMSMCHNYSESEMSVCHNF